MKKDDDNDGIAESANGYETEAFLETLNQFEDRFERNLQHFYETMSIEEDDKDEKSDNEIENDQEQEAD